MKMTIHLVLVTFFLWFASCSNEDTTPCNTLCELQIDQNCGTLPEGQTCESMCAMKNGEAAQFGCSTEADALFNCMLGNDIVCRTFNGDECLAERENLELCLKKD